MWVCCRYFCVRMSALGGHLDELLYCANVVVVASARCHMAAALARAALFIGTAGQGSALALHGEVVCGRESVQPAGLFVTCHLMALRGSWSGCPALAAPSATGGVLSYRGFCGFVCSGCACCSPHPLKAWLSIGGGLLFSVWARCVAPTWCRQKKLGLSHRALMSDIRLTETSLC